MEEMQYGPGTGYLVVRVSTARGALPLPDASVRIRGEGERSGILFALQTDRDGLTEKVPLATPSPSVSQAPGEGVPFATYGVDVFLEGYVPLSFQNVPVFPSVVSLQPAVMVPLPEGFSSRDAQEISLAIPREKGGDA